MLAWVKAALGKYGEAEQLLRESIEAIERSLGPQSYQIAYQRTSLAGLFVKTHRYTEAIPELRTALTIYDKTLPKNHQYVPSALYWLGEALLGANNPREALTTLMSAKELGEQSKAPAWLVARTESALGQAYADVGDRVQAQKHLLSAYEKLKSERGENDEATRLALARWESFNAKSARAAGSSRSRQ